MQHTGILDKYNYSSSLAEHQRALDAYANMTPPPDTTLFPAAFKDALDTKKDRKHDMTKTREFGML